MKGYDVKEKEKEINKYRSKLFGLVINPLIKDEVINWKELTKEEIDLKLKELGFPNKFELRVVLANLEVKNVNGTETTAEDFQGQLELGSDTRIPHYQIAVKMKTICTKKEMLETLKNKLQSFINIETQFNYNDMKEYCSKESEYISEEYSGSIYKKEWKINFTEKRPELRTVLESPYPWQQFFLKEVLEPEPASRVVDWLIDPVGNTGKSSFARAYVSQPKTDALLIKIDNLDRMELALIQKIQKYRETYCVDPKIIFFDFPRAVEQRKVIAATALMEDAKSGYLETSFGGKHREIGIGNVHIIVMSNTAPDLSVLSTDRWRLWRLGGKKYSNVIWPCKANPFLKSYDTGSKSAEWSVVLNCYSPLEIAALHQYNNIEFNKDWYYMNTEANAPLDEVFGSSAQFTKNVVTGIADTPNEIRLKIMGLLRSKNLLMEYEINHKDKGSLS